MGIDLWFQTNISASRPPILKVKVLKWPPIWGICFNAKKIRLSSWTGWENPEKPSFLNYIYRELLSHNLRTVLFVTFRTFLATCAHAQLQITPSIQSCLKLQMSTESLKSMLTIFFIKLLNQTVSTNHFTKTTQTDLIPMCDYKFSTSMKEPTLVVNLFGCSQCGYKFTRLDV